MFSHFQTRSNPNLKPFDIYKREQDGRVHRIGVIQACNQVQADTKAKFMYRGTVWAKARDTEAA
jgi:hypothetical protein